MAKGGWTRWIAVPVALAAAAGLWFALGGRGASSVDATGDREGNAATAVPEDVTGEASAALAGAKGVRPRERTPEPSPEDAAPTFAKAEGVFGRVVDSKDKGIAGAKVTLLPDSGSRGWGLPDGAPIAVATSGEDGAYLVGPAPAGRSKVRAEAKGYAAGVATVTSKGARADVVLFKGGSVRLTVRDGAGQAVKGAEVRLVASTGVTSVAKTGDGGEALVDSLAPGPSWGRVLAAGFAPTNVPGLNVVPGQVVERTCVLGTGTGIHGKVVDEAEAPIEGAEVTASPQWDQPAFATTKSAADGTFTVPAAGGAGDQLSISAKKEGFATGSQQLSLQASGAAPQEVVIRLGKPQTISGTVTDASDAPAKGARVFFPNPQGAASPYGAPEATTDAQGRFTLTLPWAVPKGQKEWSYAVFAVGASGGVGAAQVASARADAVRIRLLSTGAVTGKVTGSDGSPVEGANVLLSMDFDRRNLPADPSIGANPWILQQGFSDPRVATLAACTDASGRYRIAEVPAAGYRASAMWGLERSSLSDAVTVRAGATETIDLVVGGGSQITGTVTDTAGVPIAGATVVANDPQGRRGNVSRSGSARTDVDGTFVLRSLSGDRYQVYVSANGYAPCPKISARVGDRLEPRLTPLGWVEGVVLYDGKPWPGAFSVSAQSLATDSSGPPSPVNTITSVGGLDRWRGPGGGGEQTFASADGRFTYRGLPAGPWRIQVTTREGLVAVGAPEVTVADGQGVGPIEVRLQRGATFSGTLVEGSTRQPLEGASLNLQMKQPSTPGGPTSGSGAQTDAQGRFAMTGLAGGVYTLTVYTPVGFTWDEEVRLESGQDVRRDLTSERWGGVRVTAQDDKGAPVVGANVAFQTERGTYIQVNWEGMRREGRLDFSKPNVWESLQQTDATGTNVRGWLPPGRLKVVVNHKDYASAESYVQVTSDRETPITLTMTPNGAPADPAPNR
jgi:hypothetical protein